MESENIFEFETTSNKIWRLTLDDEIYLDWEFLWRIDNENYICPKQEVEAILTIYWEELLQIFDYNNYNFKI